MLLSDFSFELPDELIAQHPAEPRDHARLFVYNRHTGEIAHRHVYDLPELLPKHTLLVANNSKVRRARLHGIATRPSGAQTEVEVLVIEPAEPDVYRCLIRGSRIQPGTTITLTPSLPTLEVTGTEPTPQMTTFLVRFPATVDWEQVFEEIGELPLPPYITTSTSEADRYQTVFAQEVGSAAAPTAGLHLTSDLIGKLQQAGMSWAEVTLHVGLGTFLPLRQDSIRENTLHTEHTWITPEVAQQINHAKTTQQPILAVGTTATRTLESHTEQGCVQPGELATNMFIYPGYHFQTVSCLLTNFHLPKSSLLVLLAAFLGDTQGDPLQGITLLHKLYEEAIRERYRFYSFGDAMLVL